MSFCQNCGNELSSDVKFCPSCGKSKDNSTPNSPNNRNSNDNNTKLFTALDLNKAFLYKGASVCSAIIIIIMFFCKWFVMPILEVIFNLADMFYSGTGNFNVYADGLSIFDFFGLCFKIIGNFSKFSDFTNNKSSVFVFVFSAITVILSIFCIIALLSFLWSVYKKSNQYVTYYKNSLILIIILCVFTMIGIIIINMVTSKEIGSDFVDIISLKPAYYLTAVISLLGMIFILPHLNDKSTNINTIPNIEFKPSQLNSIQKKAYNDISNFQGDDLMNSGKFKYLTLIKGLSLIVLILCIIYFLVIDFDYIQGANAVLSVLILFLLNKYNLISTIPLIFISSNLATITFISILEFLCLSYKGVLAYLIYNFILLLGYVILILCYTNIIQKRIIPLVALSIMTVFELISLFFNGRHIVYFFSQICIFAIFFIVFIQEKNHIPVSVSESDNDNQKIIDDSEPIDFCYYCGEEINPNQKNCSKCGKKLNK